MEKEAAIREWCFEMVLKWMATHLQAGSKSSLEEITITDVIKAAEELEKYINHSH